MSIDFSADLLLIVRQDPMAFTMIKPIGPYDEYRDYGFVDSLQETIHQSLANADGRQEVINQSD